MKSRERVVGKDTVVTALTSGSGGGGDGGLWLSDTRV